MAELRKDGSRLFTEALAELVTHYRALNQDEMGHGGDDKEPEMAEALRVQSEIILRSRL